MYIINNLEDVEQIWGTLVVPDTLYDEYAFRFSFFDSEESDLYVAVDSLHRPQVLLPLEQNKKTKTIRFIGTPFLERNRGFHASKSTADLVQLYEKVIATKLCELDDIATSDPVTKTQLTVGDESAYIYDFAKQKVSSVSDLHSIVSTRLAERLVTAESYIDREICIEDVSQNETVDVLKEISFERFGEDSWLENPVISNAVRKLPQITTTQPLEVVSRILVTKTGHSVGGHIGIVHNNTYYTLFSAARYAEALPEIGTLVHVTAFKMALESNCSYLDTGLGDCGWKTRWGFETVPQFKIIHTL